ncbi:MAG: gamma-glutamylcyclotransferase [Halothiobacillus sp.]|nr:gamma-glutamylcyclotransferase [Halothiobacillus sp.]
MSFKEYSDKELISLATANDFRGTLAHELATRFRDWLNDWDAPDTSEYPEDTTLRVAVYGTLRLGQRNHRLLEGYKCLGTTTLAGFDMYNLGAFPAVTHGAGEITVEVYEIGTRALKMLDHLEGFPDFHDRETVETPFGDAVIYTVSPSVARKEAKIQSGNWLTARKSSDYFLMDEAMAYKSRGYNGKSK